ncbi:HAD-IIB family hydrolase [Thomasclavelia ramosa]|uniref:HAD-IIB family hydrolase n=1 Tax=Thomasclavelia ramosa TaxID=1547 RepID=UPI00189C9A0A|nr:HAD-IIB family hydrolase [Thomasclavelia ramosa]
MKAIASDFDGTIYFENQLNKFNKADLEAIRIYQKKGHLFGLCTGRPLNGIVKLTSGLIDFDFYILSSGAVILDKKFNILTSETINFSVLKRICTFVSDKFIVSIQSNNKLYSLKEKSNIPIEQIIIQDIDELKYGDIYGISFDAITIYDAKQMADEINKQFNLDVKAFQNKNYVDVVSKRTSKGKALEYLKSTLNIDTLYSIGDSYNDIPMFEKSDYAYTFLTSPDDVKKQADFVIDSVNKAIKHNLENSD